MHIFVQFVSGMAMIVCAAHELEAAIKEIRSTEPEIGVKRLTTKLSADNPTWELNTKTVKDALSRLSIEATPAPAPAAAAPTTSSSAPGTGRRKFTADTASARKNCAACGKGVQRSPTRVMCVCTTVVFCSEQCEALALAPGGAHACKGPPSRASFDMDEFLREKLGERRWSIDQHQMQREYMAEMQKTVQSKFRFRGGPKQFTLDEFVRCADQSPACAFQAGLMLKTQVVGTPEYHPSGHVTMHRDQGGFCVLEDEAKSIKYFTMAAEAGLGVAMLSLGESLSTGKGVRKDERQGLCWFWQGALIGSANCLLSTNSHSIMPLEVKATLGSMQQFLDHPSFVDRILPGHRVTPSGPNLGSLLSALIRPLARSGFMLPPFAATTPGGSTPTLSRVPLLAQQELSELLPLMNQLEKERGITIEPMYGRRGTGKQATVAAQGTKKNPRLIDSQLFVVPPTPPRVHRGCDAPTEEQVLEWTATAKRIKFPVDCVHISSDHPDKLPVCDTCLAAARERLAALDRGAVMLSLHETLPGDGQLAIYLSTSGVRMSETFRSYSRAEIEVALAALVLAGPRDLSHPLFIAQDPNLLWPAAYYHGSVRAALAFVAPHVAWTERIPVLRAAPDPEPLLASGRIAKRCGADACLNLEAQDDEEPSDAPNFLKCAGCLRRRYCSRKCQLGDYPLHKGECPGVPQPPPADLAAAPTPVMDFGADDSVLIQGLVAKPELNGRAAVVKGPLNEAARHPVEIPGRTAPLALKPANLLRLGVKRAGKLGLRLECSAHGGEVCEVCCLDLSIANHLIKLRHSQGGEKLSEDTIERVANAHFAKMPRAHQEEGTGYLDPVSPLLPGVPEGPADRRGVLRAALKSPEKEIVDAVAAAVVGLACFGVRAQPIAQPSVLPHLVYLTNM